MKNVGAILMCFALALAIIAALVPTTSRRPVGEDPQELSMELDAAAKLSAEQRASVEADVARRRGDIAMVKVTDRERVKWQMLTFLGAFVLFMGGMVVFARSLPE